MIPQFDPTWVLMSLLRVYGWALLCLAGCCAVAVAIVWWTRASFPERENKPGRVSNTRESG